MLIKELSDLIYQETGISLDPTEVVIKEEGDFIRILISGHQFANLDKPDPMEDDREFAWEILQRISHLKERLTKIRIRIIEDSMKPVYNSIKEILLSSFDEGVVEGIEMEIRDLGYAYHHTMTEEEAERGYPDIGFCLTDFEDTDYCFLIPVDNFNENEVREELLKDFHAFVCSTKKNNQK